MQYWIKSFLLEKIHDKAKNDLVIAADFLKGVHVPIFAEDFSGKKPYDIDK